MIKYLKHSEIDKELWDNRISESPQGNVYAFSWYLDIVSPGWEALVSNDYKMVFPLTGRKKLGISYLFQPYFTQQLGLFSSSIISEEDTGKFLDAIPQKYRLIEIQLNVENRIAKSEKFLLLPRKTHLLDLSLAESNLRANYSENLRRNLRKSVTSNTILSDHCLVKEVIELFRENRGKEIENLKEADYEVLEQLMSAANERKLLEVISIQSPWNDLIAAAIFLRSVHSYIFIFSSTSEEGKRSGAMSRIIDSFIEKHSGEKKQLDFEGSMDENLARYYKSFGSQEVVYLQVRKNNLPLLIRWLK